MEFLNIGPIELLIIVLIMFVLLGPKEMLNTSRRAGKLVRDITRSSLWKQMWGITQDIRELPQKFMDDAELADTVADIKQNVNDMRSGLSTQLQDTASETNKALAVSKIDLDPSTSAAAQENKIAPAAAVPYSNDDSTPAVLPTTLTSPEIPVDPTLESPTQESVPTTGNKQE